VEHIADAPLDEQRIGELQASGEHAAAFAGALEEAALDPSVRAEALNRSAASLDDPVRKAQAVEAVVPTSDAEDGADSVFASVTDWGAWLEVLFEHPDAEVGRRQRAVDRGVAWFGGRSRWLVRPY
jgi:hypothetical protein